MKSLQEHEVSGMEQKNKKREKGVLLAKTTIQ